MGVYDSLARGIESGFSMGMRADEAKERKRRHAVEEDRLRIADERAKDEHQMRQQREHRDQARADRIERNDAMDRGVRAALGRQKEILDLSTAAQTAGQPVDPALADEYGRNAQWLARTRQSAMDFFSRAQTGQINPLEADPRELYMHWTAATGMLPEELPKVQKAIADVEAGMQTGNQGLLVQGVNGLMAPQLRVGVGSPSPHGSTIVRKEIIGLDPARDANGQDHPNMVIPRLRVYVKTDKGEERYYDAPITKKRTGDPDDPVVAIDIRRAMDWMGNLGVLAQTAQNPEVAERLAAGGKSARSEAERYLNELTLLSKPAKKSVSRERVDLGDRVLEREVDSTGKVTGEKELKKGAQPKVFRPASGGGGKGGAAAGALRAKLDAIDDMEESGEVDAEEATEMRKSAVAGIKPKTEKGPSARETADDEIAALNAVAAKMGLDYDSTTKVYRNRDGTPVTPAQKERLGAAKTAIQAAARDASGKRKPVADLTSAGEGAQPSAKPKFEVGKTYKDAAGRQAVYQADGTWKPVK